MVAIEEIINLDSFEPKLNELRDQFSKAEPFPHIVLDNFLLPEIASTASKSFPEINGEEWINYIHYNSRKHGLSHISMIPKALEEIIQTLNSDEFLNILERLTGINGLLADHTLDGGGLHQSSKGGYLNIHADFTGHPKENSWSRKVNVIVYMNDNWLEDYGGHLELWTPDMKQCVQKILPVLNRCVIFRTNETSFHGHPDPLNCLDNMSRKSIALYYFTSEKKVIKNNPTNYKARPHDKKVLIAVDNKMLKLYKKVIEKIGIDDSFMSKILKRFSKS